MRDDMNIGADYEVNIGDEMNITAASCLKEGMFYTKDEMLHSPKNVGTWGRYFMSSVLMAFLVSCLAVSISFSLSSCLNKTRGA